MERTQLIRALVGELPYLARRCADYFALGAEQSRVVQCRDEPERSAAGSAAHGAASPVLRGVARGDAVRRGARRARVRRRGGALLRVADAARDGAHGAPQLPRERHARVTLVGPPARRLAVRSLSSS